MRRLAEMLANPTSTPDTLASSRSMRLSRCDIVGALLDFLSDLDDERLRTVVVINKEWRYPTGRLHEVGAATIKQSFRTHLNRAGVSGLPGFIIGFLEGEFERTDGVYQLHYHLVTTRKKAKALKDSLRGEWGYVETPTGAAPIHRRRVQDREKQISYLFKAFWRERSVFETEGTSKRGRESRRIVGEQNAEHLLWLHESNLTDLMILNKVVLRGGQFHRM